MVSGPNESALSTKKFEAPLFKATLFERMMVIMRVPGLCLYLSSPPPISRRHAAS